MPTIEPGDREEMLLQGILNGDTTTNIEPGSRKEMLLKAILENGGGGGGLPVVTQQDDGKVLKVENGQWTADSNAPLTEIAYANLVELRNTGKLIAGTQYRITDYETIITGSYNLSALGAEGYIHYARSTEESWFDIIVTADDESHLNENARAARSDGVTYAPDAKPEAWELKYTIDNDTTRFAWADAQHGKGVIYWMKDEHNNSAGYDFKSIQFLRYALKLADATADYTPSDTGLVYDASTQPNRYGSPYKIFTALQSYMETGNYVNPFPMNRKGQTAYNYDFSVGYNILGTIQFPEADDTYLSTFGADWYYTFDYYKDGEHYDISSVGFEGINTKCEGNFLFPDVDAVAGFLDSATKLRGLGANCWENNYVYDSETHAGYTLNNHIGLASLFNTFGGKIEANKFGQVSFDNIFGNNCNSNTFGDNCNSNTFGDNCDYNTFGNNCDYNTFGNNCDSNTFGNSCYFNTFGNNCDYNTFGDDCDSNTFGNNCDSNTFGNSCYSNTFGNNCDYNTFGNSCNSNTFGDSCNSNAFESNCDSNTFESNCYYNTFGDDCDSNTFGNSCDSNTFGNNCYSNTFGNNCDYNTFGDDCDSNTFGNNCDSNTFGNNCYSNTFGTLDTNNILVGSIYNLTADNGVNQITVPTAEANGNYLYELVNYAPKTSYSSGNGCATLITKTGYNTSTAKSTTDSGTTWA